MGIDPKVWGPSAWSIVHSIAFNRVKTNQDLNVAKHLIYSFLAILPCEKCRQNFDGHMIALPPPNQVSEFPKWTYLIHKRVNGDITWYDAKAKWQQHVITWREAYRFLTAVASTHPTLRYIDSCYLDNLDNFVRALRYFLDGSPRISKADLSSRRNFKAWVEKIGRKHNVSSSRSDNICKSSCLTRSVGVVESG